MEAIIVGLVIKKAIDVAENLAIKGNFSLYSLQEDIGWIQVEMTRIQSFLKDADANPNENEGLSNLRREIQNLAYDVEDIMDKYFPKIIKDKSRKVYGFSFLYAKYQFSVEIKGIKRRVEDINRARITFGIAESVDRQREKAWDRRRPYIHLEEQNIIGFDKNIEELKKKLLDKEASYDVISIVGMPGLGKTTLGKKVFQLVKAEFQCCVVVNVSQEPDIQELLQDIATQVKLSEGEQENNIEANIFEVLRKKKYVIFLDDIWSSRVWDAFKICIPNDSVNGGRVIITSRSREVGLHIGGVSSLHELKPLNQNDSWKLFSTIVMDPRQNPSGEIDSPELEDLGRKITRKCGGIPLSIVVTAGLLLSRERTELAWNGILGKMGHGRDDECSKILSMSYQDLPPYLKLTFLYFGTFPEDSKILVFDLINLWVAEKLIESSADQTLEEIGEEYLGELVSRYLIEVISRGYDGRIKSCRIHDLLHSLCISLAMKNDFFCVSNNATSSSDAFAARRFITHGKNFITSNLTPKLRSLLCPSEIMNLTSNELKFTFERFIFIRVLNIRIYNIRNIPDEIGNLIHLRYLQLGSLDLTNLPPSISNLKELQTLHVKRCPFLPMPTFILKMHTLQHIVFHPLSTFITPSCTKFRRITKQTKISLPNIQTLSIIPVCSNFQSNWLQKLTSLRILDLVTHRECNFPPIELQFSCHPNLFKLTLRGKVGNTFALQNFPPNLTKLNLFFNQFDENHMKTIEELPKLRSLRMDVNSYTGKSMFFSGANSFRQLQVLKLRLLWLTHLIAVDGALPKLKKLKVYSSGKIEIYPERIKSTLIR